MTSTSRPCGPSPPLRVPYDTFEAADAAIRAFAFANGYALVIHSRYPNSENAIRATYRCAKGRAAESKPNPDPDTAEKHDADTSEKSDADTSEKRDAETSENRDTHTSEKSDTNASEKPGAEPSRERDRENSGNRDIHISEKRAAETSENRNTNTLENPGTGTSRKRGRENSEESDTHTVRKRKSSSQMSSCPYRINLRLRENIWRCEPAGKSSTHNHDWIEPAAFPSWRAEQLEPFHGAVIEMCHHGLRPQQIATILRAIKLEGARDIMAKDISNFLASHRRKET